MGTGRAGRERAGREGERRLGRCGGRGPVLRAGLGEGAASGLVLFFPPALTFCGPNTVFPAQFRFTRRWEGQLLLEKRVALGEGLQEELMVGGGVQTFLIFVLPSSPALRSSLLVPSFSHRAALPSSFSPAAPPPKCPSNLQPFLVLWGPREAASAHGGHTRLWRLQVRALRS